MATAQKSRKSDSAKASGTSLPEPKLHKAFDEEHAVAIREASDKAENLFREWNDRESEYLEALHRRKGAKQAYHDAVQAMQDVIQGRGQLEFDYKAAKDADFSEFERYGFPKPLASKLVAAHLDTPDRVVDFLNGEPMVGVAGRDWEKIDAGRTLIEISLSASDHNKAVDVIKAATASASTS